MMRLTSLRVAPLPGHPAARGLGLGLVLTSALLTACQAPDGRALQKLACEQAAANLDMQSVSQMDALRKALGVAPGVDPIRTCKELGADMTPRQQPAVQGKGEGEGEAASEP
jgi:hypothetical protein